MPLADFIRVARGEKEADCLLRNARLINVLSGEITPTEVAIYQGKIAGFGCYKAREEINLRGLYLMPGFIEGHLHLESSMLSVRELARAIVPLGTTTIVIDPHEIANVLGLEGIRTLIAESEGLPLDVYLMLPSCVPATDMETAGARLTARDLSQLIEHPRVLGVAEVMNYPGVINCDPEVMAKVELGHNKIVDGHAPFLSGKDLAAYAGAGIQSDHECTLAEEALEKLRMGMHIMVREGSTARNLSSLLPIINLANSRRFSLVSDDRHPLDLEERGHLDGMIRMAIEEGIDPIIAIQMATLNTASYFGLNHIGAVAPGYQADLVAVDDFEKFCVKMVFKKGKLVVNGNRFISPPPDKATPVRANSINLPQDADIDFRIKAEGEKVKVIGVITGQIVTKKMIFDAPEANGEVTADVSRDLLKIAVIERHTGRAGFALGLVHGFGLYSGAIASSVAHDSHNIIIVGTNDRDMKVALREIIACRGGLAVASEGWVRASLALPFGGLMTDAPLEQVSSSLKNILKEVRALGCQLPDPFMSLSFLALPVIPHLKITDKGLVDVDSFSLVSLWEK